MLSAEPRRLPVAIFLMNFGTSMCVGHAPVQGASKQFRQRFDSITAAWARMGDAGLRRVLESLHSVVAGFASGSTSLVWTMALWFH